MDLEAVIGLEIHVQLKTKSKMFCACDNASEGAAPNSLICPICTGHPGTLPVPNEQAIRWTVLAALALGCTIPEHAKFDRKHYVYPDLPKGYQISQYDQPIGVHGALRTLVNGRELTVGIERVHLEEDVGKLMHAGDESLVDFNRAGTPLMEVVTEPDIQSPAEAKALLQGLRLTMRYLGISDADMEKGQLRCDANVSLRKQGSLKLSVKTEIKNLNSFRSVERALAFEIARQRQLWEQNQAPTIHATRGWDEAKQETVEQRTKEGAADYRYFPEPDIPPLHFTPEFVADIRAGLPELPAARRQRLIELYGLTANVADSMVRDAAGPAVADRPFAPYFEEIVSELREYASNELGTEAGEAFWRDHRPAVTMLVANWLLNRISEEHRRSHGLPVPAADLGRLLWMVHQKAVTLPAAALIYEQMVRTKKGPHLLVKELGLEKLSETPELQAVVTEVLKEQAAVVDQYRRGKTTVLQFLIGQVMKKTGGRANVQTVRELLLKQLGQSA